MKNFRRKLDTKGFSHLELVAVLAVALIVIGVGFFVYRHDKNTSSTAHAGSWQVLGSGVAGAINPTKTVTATTSACTETVDGNTFVKVLSTLNPSVNPTSSGVYGEYDVHYTETLPNKGSTVVYLPGYSPSEDWFYGDSQEWQSESLSNVPAAYRSKAILGYEVMGQNNINKFHSDIYVSDINTQC